MKEVAESKAPVSIEISESQAKWLAARHAQQPFVRYCISIDRLALYTENDTCIRLDRCGNYAQSGCCVIKYCADVLASCEAHKHIHLKATSSSRQTFSLFAARSVVALGFLSAIVYGVVAIRRLIS